MPRARGFARVQETAAGVGRSVWPSKHVGLRVGRLLVAGVGSGGDGSKGFSGGLL